MAQNESNIAERNIEISEELNKIQLQMETALLKEKSDVDLQPGQLNRSLAPIPIEIWELPTTVWGLIMKKFVLPDNVFYPLCLGSAKLDHVIYSVAGWSKFNCNGKKIFPFLTKCHYLDQDDLDNCIQTGVDDLGNFAAVSWSWLEGKNLKLNVSKFCTSDDVRTLEEEIHKASLKDGGLWDYFTGRYLYFGSEDLTTSDWNCLAKIIEKYGKYLMNLTINVFQNHEEIALKILSLATQGKLPNLLFLSIQFANCTVYDFSLQHKELTLETSYTVTIYDRVNFYYSREICDLQRKIAEMWHVPGNIFHMNGIHFDTITIFSCCEKYLKQLAPDHGTKLNRFRKLDVFSHEPFSVILNFSTKLEALSEISIKPWNVNAKPNFPYFFLPPKDFVMSNITAFTCVVMPPKCLYELLKIFPSLRRLNLRLKCREQILDDMEYMGINEEFDEDEDGALDIYERIAKGESLRDSNIWRWFKRLSIFRLLITTGNASVIVEIYRRMEDESVKAEKTIETSLYNE